jgi:hypothetical protein
MSVPTCVVFRAIAPGIRVAVATINGAGSELFHGFPNVIVFPPLKWKRNVRQELEDVKMDLLGWNKEKTAMSYFFDRNLTLLTC